MGLSPVEHVWRLHGAGMVSDPAVWVTDYDPCADMVVVSVEGDPVDELVCGDCGCGVGSSSDGPFGCYHLSKSAGGPVVVRCEDCAPDDSEVAA